MIEYIPGKYLARGLELGREDRRLGGDSLDLSPMDVGLWFAMKTSAVASIGNPREVDCDNNGTYY